MTALFQRLCHRSFISAVPVVIAILLLVSGCSTVADGTWQKPRTTNAPFENVLVVAVVSSNRMRKDLERQLAEYIALGGSKASSSMLVESKLEHTPKSRESIIAMIEDTSADAVLVVRLVGESVTAGKTQAKAYVNVGPQAEIIEHPHVTEVWVSDYSLHQTEGFLVAESDTKMEALLYDIADKGRVVYKISVESRYEEDRGDPTFVISDNVATAVARKLRHAGLVR